ncbi:hemin uptake protein HemP [Methylogaea oryzae]
MSNDKPTITMKSGESAAEPRSGLRRRLSSAELFGGAREVVIEHGGDEYRLRVTSNGKLILTK